MYKFIMDIQGLPLTINLSGNTPWDVIGWALHLYPSSKWDLYWVRSRGQGIVYICSGYGREITKGEAKMPFINKKAPAEGQGR